jgi:phosphatidylinositol 3-kinase
MLMHFLSINVIFTLMYVIVVSLQTLLKGNADWQKRRNFLSRQQTFIDKLVRLVKTVARESGNRKKKVCCLFIIVP